MRRKLLTILAVVLLALPAVYADETTVDLIGGIAGTTGNAIEIGFGTDNIGNGNFSFALSLDAEAAKEGEGRRIPAGLRTAPVPKCCLNPAFFRRSALRAAFSLLNFQLLQRSLIRDGGFPPLPAVPVGNIPKPAAPFLGPSLRTLDTSLQMRR